jgi:hypothetical protein
MADLGERMRSMRVREFDDLAIRLLVDGDHPEIVAIRRCVTPEQPDNHSRFVVEFADESTAVVMIGKVSGPGITSHDRFQVPREAL